MSLITKNNYEAFLLDYVEGNLSPEHTAELMLFFENNPELKEDLEEFELLTLDVTETNLKNKEALKIDEDKVTALTFDDYAIAEMEGLNSNEKSEEFAVFLKGNPTYQAEFETYQKTKLEAPIVVFEDKPALKREQKVIPLYWWVTSAAAVILALFLLKGVNWSDEKIMPIIANEVENNSVKEEAFNNVETVVEEKLIADKVINESEELEDKHEPIRKINDKASNPKIMVTEEEEGNTVLIAEENPSNKIIQQQDTTVIESDIIKTDELVLQEEEIIYADDVVIVYEDDEVNTDSKDLTLASTTKKPSKFDAVRAAIKQQVNEKWLTKDNGESVFALNEGVLGLFSKKNK